MLKNKFWILGTILVLSLAPLSSMASRKYVPAKPLAVKVASSGWKKIAVTTPLASLVGPIAAVIPGKRTYTPAKPVPTAPCGQVNTRPCPTAPCGQVNTRPCPAPAPCGERYTRPCPTAPCGQVNTRPCPAPAPCGKSYTRPCPVAPCGQVKTRPCPTAPCGKVNTRPCPPPAPCGQLNTRPCSDSKQPPVKKPTPPATGKNPGLSRCHNRPYPRDIDGHWAEIYVRRLYDLCIIEGYRDNTFRPDQFVTRVESTKMALLAAKIALIRDCYDADCGTPYTDPDLQMWQGPILRAAFNHHIIDKAPRFWPNRNITRAEATKVILSAFGYQPLSVTHSFFYDVFGWPIGWVDKAQSLGIVQGIGKGLFDPNRPITRAEAAKIIAKTIEMADTKIQ